MQNTFSDEAKKKRMDEDLRFITQYWSWPSDLIHLKEQPWIKANGRRFGLLTLDDRLKNLWHVHVKDTGEVEEFRSLTELVEVWSVD